MRLLLSLLTAVSLLAGLTTAAVAEQPDDDDLRRFGDPTAEWTAYDRPAEHAVITETDVEIVMPDGVVLVGDVHRPDAEGRFPVILTMTPYNKNAMGAANPYFVERGYAHAVVDVRGTGGSEGTWDAWGIAEQADGPVVVEWAADQPWSNGEVGMWGTSYLAINQLFTAAQQPPSLKAIFPQVPVSDAFRDISVTGGQINSAFIPLFFGLVTGLGALPPSYTADDPLQAAQVLAMHGAGAATFQGPALADAYTDGDFAYDGPIFRQRSPIEYLDDIEVPTFLVGGLRDIFQRGVPLLYEGLRQRDVPVRMLMGDWTHTNLGSGLPSDSLPLTLTQLALRWFDHHLKGLPEADIREIPPVTQLERGVGDFQVQADWPNPALAPSTLHLRTGGLLATAPPAGAEEPEVLVQAPISGACTGSTQQWSAGIVSGTPCDTDNRANEPAEAVFTTPVLEEDLRLDGPIAARVWLRTTAEDASLAVRVTDVAPDGTSTQLSGGLMTASFRELDQARSRYVDGRLLMPYHPFTRASVREVPTGEPVAVDVEIFPVNATIAAGHQLRVSVGASDVPRSAPPVQRGANQYGGVIELLHDADHPSHVNLPTLG